MNSTTEITDWFDIIRHPAFIPLAHMNHQNRIVFKVTGGNGDFTIDYDGLYAIKEHPTCFKNLPDYMAVHEPTLGGIHYVKNLLFIWGELEGKFIRPHREDGFPALIEVVGLKKHYLGSTIGRKDNERPALKADYIFAHWMENNKRHRPVGPPVVQIRDYREYWKDGKIYFYREGHVKLYWGDELVNNDHFENFLNNLRGTVDPRMNSYFQNKKDEFQFMLDYSIKGMNKMHGTLTHRDAVVLK
jgi:hypothetical protein